MIDPQKGTRTGEAYRLKRDAWRDKRTLVVDMNDPSLDFVEREFIRQIGERLYGETRRFKGNGT